MSRLGDLKSLLANRWQVPLAVVALVCASVAFQRLSPKKPDIPYASLLADVLALAESGRFHDATNATVNLLQMEPPPPKPAQATLHNALADIIHQQESLRSVPINENVQLLLHHHDEAYRLGKRPSAWSILRAAQAHEWLGEVSVAVRGYRTVLEHRPSDEHRRAALRALVRLLEERPGFQDQRRQYIEALLREENVSPAYAWSALRRAVDEAIDRDDLRRANDLVIEYADRFRRSDLQAYHDLLWARVMLATGDHARAEPALDRVEQWLAANPRTDPAMDAGGFLPAMLQWIRGELHLAEDRPQVALQQFARAIRLESRGDAVVYCTSGVARALAALERHEPARRRMRELVETLTSNAALQNTARARLRSTALALAGARHAGNDAANAVAYAQLALEFTVEDDPDRLAVLERLGRESEWAARFSESDAGRSYHALAGECYEQAADLATLEDDRFATLLWSSAQQYDLAGLRDQTQRVLQRFIDSRSNDARMPRALLKLGQTYAAQGLFGEANTHFEQLIERYPRLAESARARLLAADAFVALGQTQSAEVALLDLLEADTVAPDADVYREALLALCTLYYQENRFADAIGRIENYLEFFSSDPAGWQLRFMLADSYRRSAYALRDAPNDAQSLQAQADESIRRFERAAELFAEYLLEAQARDTQDEAVHTFRRLALFYRGDCLYAINNARTLEQALGVYRQAAATYQSEPATLTAHVQIANIHLRRGRMREAAAAVERARWLLNNIADSSFSTTDGGQTREDWDLYLGTLMSSNALREATASTP